MSTGYQWWDRRRAVRRATPGKVWWHAEEDTRPTLGWLSDTSQSGMTFVSSAADGVVPGQTLRVSRGHPRRRNSSFEAFRVCRIEPYGPNCELVACTRIFPAEQPSAAPSN
jgi:hypothetical protein